MTNAFKGMEDALASFVTTGKLDFKGLVNSMISDIARIAIKQQITGPLANALNGAIGGSGGDGASGGGLLSLLGSAAGAIGGTGAQAGLANALPGDSLDNLFRLTGSFAGRAIGGPVSAGSLHPVNERGPVLLNVAGKQYLMMGDQPGTVSPTTGNQGGGMSVTNNFSFSEAPSRKTQDQVALAAGNAVNRARRNA